MAVIQLEATTQTVSHTYSDGHLWWKYHEKRLKHWEYIAADRLANSFDDFTHWCSVFWVFLLQTVSLHSVRHWRLWVASYFGFFKANECKFIALDHVQFWALPWKRYLWQWWFVSFNGAIKINITHWSLNVTQVWAL